MLDYYAYDSKRVSEQEDDYSQLGVLSLSPRPLSSTVPGTASVQFDEPFSAVPNVFAQVRIGSGGYAYPFIITVTSISETHVEFSYACTGKIIVTSNAYHRLGVDSTGTYTCIWDGFFDLDWRAWPTSYTSNVNGTEVVTNGGEPYHAFTYGLTSGSTTRDSMTHEEVYTGVGFDKEKEAPPGMLGMVYMGKVSLQQQNL